MGQRGQALCMPSFFVIGPPRTGTSWLHEVLNQHTVLPALSKETRFFDSHFRRGFHWYSSHFRHRCTGQPLGEIAPTYFASRDARERISPLTSSSRSICTFSNTIERILSLYPLKCAYGFIPWTFEQALVKDPELLEFSKYSTHLKAWQNALRREQVLATIFDDLQQRLSPLSMPSLASSVFRGSKFLSPRSRAHASDTMTRPRNY